MKNKARIFGGVTVGVLWHLAYVFPERFGLLIIPALGGAVQMLWSLPHLHHAALWGLSVGFGLYLGHFWWLFALLWTQTDAAWWQGFLVYLVPVFVYTALWVICSCMIWLATSNNRHRVLRIIFSALIVAGYLYAIESWGGIILGVRLGYPLIHPGLPLVHLCTSNNTSDATLVPLHPQNQTVASLYHALSQATVDAPVGPRIFMTPERAVAAVLADEFGALESCGTQLTRSDILCVGALSCTGTALHQAAYLYTQKGLLGVVAKKTLVPLYEYVPGVFQRIPFFRNLFLRAAEPFCCADAMPYKVLQWGDVPLEVFVCADFFLTKNYQNTQGIWVILVNDRVLEPYAAELLKRVAQWRAWQHGRTAFYVGWRNSLKI